MYKVAVKYNKNLEFIVNSGNNSFLVDADGLAGVTPPGALLASLASCMGVYIVKYFKGAKLNPGDFEVSVEAEFPKEPPYGFKEIKVIIDLKGSPLDERRREALLSFIKNCPVHNTLRFNPQLEVNILNGY